MEQKQLETMRTRIKILSGIVVLLVIALCAVTIIGINKAKELPAPEEPLALPAANLATSGTAALDLWTDEAKLKSELTEYMANITNPESPDFIPVQDRIAVFDMDGTVLCETDPVYFDHRLLLHRVMEDPEYKDKASDFEREVAGVIQNWIDTGESPADLPVNHGKAVASAFAGFTVDQFLDYVSEYKKLPEPGYDGMTNGEAFYKPMLQMIEYLQANEFTVYIVSGTDRLITRAIVDGAINIPSRQVIGSDETIVATGQGETDGLDYAMTDTDQLILGGDFVVKNLKMNKVDAIIKEIGQQPVLAFGNTSGDFSMVKYTTANNRYKSLGYMVCCDDLERENGNTAKAEKMVEMCKENGWTPISMKNDWKTIYGEGVTYKGNK